MNFQIEKEEFIKGLYRTQSIVEKKGTMPILLNVLIETYGSGITLIATDLEIAIKGTHSARIIKEGKATVSAKKLYEVVKELPESNISVRLRDNQWVEISSGKSNFNILGLAAENFPSLPIYEEEGFYFTEAGVLKELIEKTVFAVSSDESRYNLTGVFFIKTEGTEEGIRMVATDGYRLSMIDRPIKWEGKSIESGILLPKKGLLELSKMLNEEGEKVGMKLKNNNLVIKKDNFVLIMRLLDAEFPDYRQVIPSKTKHQIRLRRNQLLESLHRVSLLSSEKTKGVKFHFSQDVLELSSYNPEIGEAKEEMIIDYKGEDLVAGFNARFILEVLDVLTSDEVVFGLEEEKSPVIILPTNDEKHTCVVMPMRI